MIFSEKAEYALITIYGDTPEEVIESAVKSCISDRDIRLLMPSDKDTLEQAAQNSSLIIMGISSDDDPNFILAKRLQDNRMVVSDIIAFYLDGYAAPRMEIVGKGFDFGISPDDAEAAEFKKFLVQKIASGNRRLTGLIQEEEYRRICDALSNAPASMIVFDADKRAVFVSDHYFRAYPKIAPRLIRGLSVYDSFDMMMREEGIPENDERYPVLQKFWHNLEGSIEFTLDDGTTYRLKAVQLPNRRGTVVMGQNVSDYFQRKNKFEEESSNIINDINELIEILGELSAQIGESDQNATDELRDAVAKDCAAIVEQLEALQKMLDIDAP